ncbi:penicillin-binding protein [Metabacillus fastidiosus]|uniref:serine-type D-Ala-D-Ala carboxypeptidase n=2 Tax=Metabacillus fastidiosus TaxID=1458 RepID=A0ABU6NX34_9BACI|nr:penicillin-binding protein [Metabacillus fastidiosus]MED4401674.1 penicillin-binding protein [Metabacillus fastidiosus]MED4463313.1 penicillin-binding protein [Metabacillus fastidiosus]
MKMRPVIKNKNINRGAAILSLIFAVLFFIVFARFFYIQATGEVHGEALVERAEKMYSRTKTLEAYRGKILDRNGEAIAEDTSSYKLIAILDKKLKGEHVVNPEETAEKLAPLIGMKEEEVERILKKDAKQVEFGANGRDISQTLKQKIDDLKLQGITFIRDKKRFYPNGTFASHLIGYAQKDIDTGETIGMFGIEKSLEKYLQEKDGYLRYESDQKGWKLPNGKEEIVAPKNGDNVYLTIDQKIQTFLEDSMNEVAKQYKPEKVIAVVADPKTGQILAMGQRPSFDPNKRNINYYYNDVVSYPFEPGSTMKIFTLAAAIEEGVYNGNAFFSSGSYMASKRAPLIKDHNKSGWGSISFNEGVQRSSNVAFSIIGKELLGTDRLYEYFSKFGFDKKTGIDLPNEAKTVLNSNTEFDKVISAFGQATAVTPIQQIQAATAIANGGKMMKPYVIDKIVDIDKEKIVEQHKPEVAGQPISKKTSEKVLDILETVVSGEHGTGKPFQIEGYDVAGKTGTAQIADGPNGYLRGNDNHVFSFLGMAPKEDPQLIVYVGIQQPKLNGQAGSTPVSMIFNTVMKNSLQYLQIKPTEKDKKANKVETGETLPLLREKTLKEASEIVKEKNFNIVVLGDGDKIIDQFPEAKTSIIANEKVLIQTSEKVKMPDIIGWSKRDVMKLANLLELELESNGHGFVTKQTIKKGSVIKKGDKLVIQLKDQLPKEKEEDEKEEQEQQAEEN